MKKLLTTLLLTLLAVTLCNPFHCDHKHTNECGEDGENCTHVCEEYIEPYEKGWPHA